MPVPVSKKKLFGCLVLAWMVIIFSFSSMPGVSSSYASPWWYVMERKGAHVTEFFILALLVRAYFSTYPKIRKSPVAFFLLGVLFCTTYAFSDEIHQFFVVGREARFTDVLIDTGGAFLGTLIAFFWEQKKVSARLRRIYRSCKTKTSR